MNKKIGIYLCLSCLILFSGCITIVTKAEPTQAPPPPPTAIILPTNAPQPTFTPQPVLISSGTIDIPQTYMADMDTGIVPKSSKDSMYNEVDLWFEAVSPQERYLEPYNGASWSVVGPNPVNMYDCLGMNPSPARMDIRNLPSGTYICMFTNVKNISVLRINSINYGYKGSIRLDYSTWRR